MGSDRLTDPEPETGGGSRYSRPHVYTQHFEDLFPFYLSIGMTYELYWEKDAQLVVAYRKAYELQQKVSNQRAWMQGMYVYDAIVKSAPYLRSLKPKRPDPYPDRPYGFDRDEDRPRLKGAGPAKYEKARRNLEIFAINFNQRFRGGEKIGGQRSDPGD